VISLGSGLVYSDPESRSESLAPAGINSGERSIVSVVNWDVTHIFPPNCFRNLDLQRGSDRRLHHGVVPVILFDESTIETFDRQLEIAYLANRDERLYFALLGDFAMRRPRSADDTRILEAAQNGIDVLNRRYSEDKSSRFHLFHRRRQWCETEQKWIAGSEAWQLHELNRLLRGAATPALSSLPAPMNCSRKFVIDYSRC